jgi:predicted CoA-binding protein
LRNRGANAAVILVDGPSPIVKISPSKLMTTLTAIDRSADMVDVLCSSGTAYEVTPKSTAFGANVLFSFFTRMPKT